MHRRFASDDELFGNMEGKVDPEYLLVVEMQTERRVRDYANAERRLASAIARREHAIVVIAKAKTTSARKKAERNERKLWELIEERRRELSVIASYMTQAPATAQHRGTKSFIKVPRSHGTSF